MKQNNTGRLHALPAAHGNGAHHVKTNNGKHAGMFSRAKMLLSFSLLLALQLITGRADATTIATTGFTSSLSTTATSTCVVGYFATFGTTSTNWWKWTLSTSGYSSVQMSIHTTSSATGPTSATVYYNIGASDVLVGTYTVNTTCAVKNITLPAACNNQPSMFVKVVMSGGSGSGGTNRVSSDGGFTGTVTSFCSGTPASGSISVSSSSFCGSGTPSLSFTPGSTGSDLTYQWYDAGGAIAGATTLSYSPSVTSTATYSVVTTCPTYTVAPSSTPATTTITINPLPSVSAIGSVPSPVLLVGSTVTLTDATPGGLWLSSAPTKGSIDPGTGDLTGVSGGTIAVTYLVTDGVTGCTNQATANVNIVWPNTLGLYAGHDGTSTDVIAIADETASILTATGFGTATPCSSGGLSGLTVNTVNATYSSSGPYVSYTLTPASGHALNAFEFHVSSRSSSSGPTKARLAYRINGGSWIDEGLDHTLSTSGSCGANTNTWYWTPAAAINGITTNIEFGIFPYAPASNTGTFQVQSLEVIGVVSSDAACNATPLAGVITPSVTTACVSGYAAMTFSGDAGVGISYSWESSTDGGSSWTPIAGASNTYYTSPVQIYSVTPNTMYHVITSCPSYTVAPTATSATSVLNVGGPVSAITVTSGTINPLEVGSTAMVSDATPGGTWSSQHFSVASIGTAGDVNSLMPGITEIRYSTAGFGACTATATVNVIEPNTIAAYLGTGGSSTTVGYLAGVTSSSVTATGFTTGTSCSKGGVSGLITGTSYTSFAGTNPNVAITLTPTNPGDAILVTEIHATIRSSATGPQSVQLAYSLDGGTTWVNNGSDLGADIQDCGVSTTDIYWPAAFVTTTTNVMVGVFPYNAIGTGTFQVNSIDVVGKVAPPCITPLAAIQDGGSNALNTIHFTDGGGATLLFLATPVSGPGFWSSSNPTYGTFTPDALSNSFQPLMGACPIQNTTNVTYTAYDASNTCIGTTTDVANIFGMGCRTAAPNRTANVNSSDDVSFYPNPTTGTINIAAAQDVTVSVLSMDGKTLISRNNAKSINVSTLAPGLYMIKVYDLNDNLVKTGKFTKE